MKCELTVVDVLFEFWGKFRWGNLVNGNVNFGVEM